MPRSKGAEAERLRLERWEGEGPGGEDLLCPNCRGGSRRLGSDVEAELEYSVFSVSLAVSQGIPRALRRLYRKWELRSAACGSDSPGPGPRERHSRRGGGELAGRWVAEDALDKPGSSLLTKSPQQVGT